MQKKVNELYVLDWQIRNILRLKNEAQKADKNKQKRLRGQIYHLCQNMDYLDPDHTKRLKLIYLYAQEHMRSSGSKKSLSLLAFSLSDLLKACDPESDALDFFTKKLSENKTIDKMVKGVSQISSKNSDLTSMSIFLRERSTKHR